MKTKKIKNESGRKITPPLRSARVPLLREDLTSFLAAIVKSTDDAVIGKDLRGVILSWNPGAEKIYGYKAREAIGEPISLLCPPGQTNEIPAILKKIKQGKKIDHYQTKRRTKDGRLIDISLTVSPIKDRKGRIIGASSVGRDITRQKRMEEKIIHLTRVLRSIRNINQLIIREKNRDRLIGSACRKLIESRGYDSAWIVLLDKDGTPFKSAQAGRQEKFPALLRKWRKGDLPLCAIRALRQKGVVLTPHPASDCPGCPLKRSYNGEGGLAVRLQSEGNIFGVLAVSLPHHRGKDREELGLFQEVTGDIAFALHDLELQEARQEDFTRLWQIQEQLRTVLDASDEIIFLKDEKSRYHLVNAAFSRKFKIPLDKIIGKFDRDIFPEKEARRLRKIDLKVMREGRTDRRLDYLNVEGEERIFRTAKVPLRDPSGKITGLCGFALDITEREHLEDELRQAQKLEALGRVVGELAHDFNNLLAVIRGLTDLSLALPAAVPSIRGNLEEINRTVDRAAGLIRKLLAFSRKQKLKLQPINLNRVIGDFQETLIRIIPSNLKLSIQRAASLRKIKADPGQVEQVIMNLVLNARDALPEGGKLKIRTQNIHLDKEFARRHNHLKPGAYVLLEVQDNGRGITPEDLPYIFEPFFTSKEKGKGTGLGLSIVYGIVQQCGGRIEGISRPGEGTTFRVYFPAMVKSAGGR